MNDHRMTPATHEILVVDDTPENLQLLTRILSDNGYRVRPASDGMLALNSVAAKAPDLILLDVKMPGMDGYEVCRRLKADKKHREIPILFISALTEGAEKVKGFAAGGLDFISKPFSEEEVLARVRVHVRLRELTERLEEQVYERTKKLSEANDRLLQEIAVRQTVEDELLASRNRFRDLIESTCDWVWEIDAGGRFTYVSPQIRNLLGYEPEDVIGKTPFDLMPPDEARQIALTFGGIAEQGKPIHSLENANCHKDGHVVVLETNGVPFFDEKGALCGYRGIDRDISERKRTAQLLEKRLELSAYTFDHDISEVLQKAIDLAEELTGSSIGFYHFIDETEQTIILQQWSSQTKDHFCRAEAYGLHYGFDKGGVWTDSVMERRPVIHNDYAALPHKKGMPEGHAQLVRELVVPIFRSGRIRAILGVGNKKQDYTEQDVELTAFFADYAWDVVEHKRVEAERNKLQEQFLQAQKMESVGRLAGGVAHDFNNMLSVILGYTEMAMEKMDPAEPMRADLEEVRQAAERSANLTRQLLAFARKQTIDPQVLDLNEVVEGILKMLRRLIGEDINLTWQPKAGLWPVKIDPAQVDQILANLCVNARDAIAGVGSIAIATENCCLGEGHDVHSTDPLHGEYVRLAVSDDGSGMDKETLANIFEPFFTTKAVGEGTGLGLATVYGIVKQNNGSITVDSEPGHGTTFNIYIPRHVGVVSQTEKESSPSLMRGNETILLVEDESVILEMATQMLERLGYTVLAANSPDEAIHLAKDFEGKIDLLVTDVVMPNMNGRDLADTLLSISPQLKRLFMSGYTADIIAHQGVLDEGVQFIQKPFSQKGLAAKVREALSD